MDGRGLADDMHPLADAMPDLEEVVAEGLARFCTATSPPDTASLPHLLALPPVAPSPATDELARLLLAHHNPFHPAESPLQLISSGGNALSGDLLVQLRLRIRGASKLALSLLHATCLHPSMAPRGPYDAVMDASADGAASLVYVIAGMTRQAIRTFNDMEAFVGREPDASEFATLLDTLCKYKYPKIRDDETCSCMRLLFD